MDCAIYEGRRRVGQLDWTREGPRWRFTADTAVYDRVLYLYLLDGAGASFKLGVPAPQGGRMRLTKTVSAAQLAGFSLDAVERAILAPADFETAPAPPPAAAREPIPQASVETAAPSAAAVPQVASVPAAPRGWEPAALGDGEEPREGTVYVADPLLRQSAGEAPRPMYLRRVEAQGLSLLAQPLTADRPLAFVPAFSLFQVLRMGDAEYLVLVLDADGRPRPARIA